MKKGAKHEKIPTFACQLSKNVHEISSTIYSGKMLTFPKVNQRRNETIGEIVRSVPRSRKETRSDPLRGLRAGMRLEQKLKSARNCLLVNAVIQIQNVGRIFFSATL